VKKPIYKKLWFQVVAGLFVIGAIGNIVNPSQEETSSTTEQVASVPQASENLQSETEDRAPSETQSTGEKASSDDSANSEGADQDDGLGATEVQEENAGQSQDVEPVVQSVPASTNQLVSLIDSLQVAGEFASGYDRDLFRHWTDADGDGCNARYEVLIEESVTPVSISSGCKLSGGTWVSAFDLVETNDPSKFDVDHMVPLKEAWDSGAWAWDTKTREAYANDLGYEMSLIAVSASSNRSKSDRDPADWLPPNKDYWCEYITAWVQVKTRWSLSIDNAEKAKIAEVAEGCSGEALEFAPRASTSTAAPAPSETSAPSPSPTKTSTPSPSPTKTSAPSPSPTKTSAPSPSPTKTSAPSPSPTPSETKSSTPSPTPTQTVTGKCSVGQVDINLANWDDLQLIIHIGPVRADEIISMRSVRKFTSVDGLDDVNGIGPSRLKDIKAQNVACVN